MKALPEIRYLPQLIIGSIFVSAFAAVLMFVLTAESMADWSETRLNILMYLLGILSAQLVTVMAFFFSSSAGSKDKDK